MAKPLTTSTPIDEDEIGKYVELCFTEEMSPVILDEDQTPLKPDEVTTIRVYVSANSKQAVVVKEDDLLPKQDIQKHSKEVAVTTVTELKTWIENKCFLFTNVEMNDIKDKGLLPYLSESFTVG